MSVQYNFNVVNPSGTIIGSTDDCLKAVEMMEEQSGNTIIFSQEFVERINRHDDELELYQKIEALSQT